MTDFEREALLTIAQAIFVIFLGGGALGGWIFLSALWTRWKRGELDCDDDDWGGAV